MKDQKFKNIYTGEEITASKAYYDFCLEAHKLSNSDNKIIHPSKLFKKDLIELGIDLLEGDDHWEKV